jgi:glycosyltransferase involved in cell wall biosynthesis
VSVVVATRDRPKALDQCLGALQASEHDSFEVIVVDQSADDASARLVTALGDARVRYLPQETVGASKARNAGIAAARGAVIAFTDDDCTVPSEWLRQVEAACTGPGSPGVVLGALRAALADSYERFTPSWAPRRVRRLRWSWQSAFHGEGATANMAVRREVCERLGGFDEFLGAGAPFRSCEDNDFCERALRAGFTLLHDPRIEVLHWGARSRVDGAADGLRYDYSRGYGAMLAKHARCRDPLATYRLTALVVTQAPLGLVDVLSGGGAYTLRRLWNNLAGAAAGFVQPLDRRRRVFLPRANADQRGVTP